MSVINQMLNDLQQRQGEPKADLSQTGVPVVNQVKTHSNTALIVIISVVLTLAAVYMLKLHDENQQYKNDDVFREQLKEQSNRESNRESNSTMLNASSSAKKNVPSAVVIPPKTARNTPRKAVEIDEQLLPISEPVLAADTITVEAPSIKKPTENVPLLSASANTNKANVLPPKPVKKSSMTISRQQMTPESLAKQKINRAKEAIANNDLAKAEQLFEDVLLVLPSHQGARKQLAALWFGRRSYQAAINLLAQGIYLDPNNSELRQLKAQIYSKQNRHKEAFKVLQNLPKVEQLNQLEYQSLLASTAQISKQYVYASEAYQRLALMQPKVGRWWLGLAIAYDSNSQFLKANDAYQQALLTLDLSSSAELFAKQRMKELGE